MVPSREERMKERPCGVLIIGWAEDRLATVGPELFGAVFRDVVIRDVQLYMFQGDAALSHSRGAVVHSRIAVSGDGDASLFPIVYRNGMMSSPRKIFVHDAAEFSSGVEFPTEFLVECDKSLFPPYFAVQRAHLIPDGRWASLALFPLVTGVPLREVRHIFAYGTLRPDDKSGAPWTAKFAEGMQWETGYVRHVDLGLAKYPVVVIPSDPNVKHTGVHGTLVWCDDDLLFRSKLREADGIEGSPRLYQRGVVMVHPTSETERDLVPAFIYYRSLRDISEVLTPIPSGDFNKRDA